MVYSLIDYNQKEKMRQNCQRISKKMSQLDSLKKRFPERWKIFNQNYVVSYIYHEHALEGIVLTYEEILQALADEERASDNKQFISIRNLKMALEFVQNKACGQKEKMTLSMIKNIHAIMVQDMPKIQPGRYRKEMPIHRTYFHVIAQPSRISYQLRKYIDFLDSSDIRSYDPVKQAAKAHIRLIKTFPFPDYSGIISRLVMNFILMRYNYIPIIILSQERQRYYEALRNPHIGFRTIIAESLENCIDNAARYIKSNIEY